jgi:predicted transcriptional regulator
MKTNVAPTSIQSYDALKRGAMGNQHACIVSRMESGRAYSRREIANLTGLETSAVAGRVHELIDEGAIVSAGTMKCPITGRTVEAVRLAEQHVGH